MIDLLMINADIRYLTGKENYPIVIPNVRKLSLIGFLVYPVFPLYCYYTQYWNRCIYI